MLDLITALRDIATAIDELRRALSPSEPPLGDVGPPLTLFGFAFTLSMLAPTLLLSNPQLLNDSQYFRPFLVVSQATSWFSILMAALLAALSLILSPQTNTGAVLVAITVLVGALLLFRLTYLLWHHAFLVVMTAKHDAVPLVEPDAPSPLDV